MKLSSHRGAGTGSTTNQSDNSGTASGQAASGQMPIAAHAVTGTGPGPGGDTDGTLAGVLAGLVARGTITADQQGEILAEVALSAARTGQRRPAPRRPLTQVLIEAGLYVGSALVVAALFVLVAQNWEDFAQATQVAILAATAVVTGSLGLFLAGGSKFATARRRLAGVLLAGTAASSAATVAVAMGEDFRFVGACAMGVALLVMLAAQLVAASAVTELGLFGAAYMFLQILVDELSFHVDQFGYRYYEPTMTTRLLPLILVAFGLLWALVVAPRLAHRETAVALGMFAAVVTAMPLAGEMATRTVGLLVLAGLAAIGFWGFLREPLWPWLAGAIVSITGFVFWAVGGGDRPALAFLVAGLVLLGSSAVGLELGHHRQHRPESHSQGPPMEQIN